ncbi:ZF-HD homeobox protein, Cys/His-rich dimerization domain [Sesbania bispinosa]|nr:ZF-HD homeobox protein, Cys/His-rich dimerization domain [Sesbania bispinosa]
MPTTLVYNNHLPNRDNSSSSTLGQQIDQPDAQTHTLVFTDPPQTSHHLLYPSPNPVQLQQLNRPRRDPDLIPSSPIAATTTITSTPIVNLPRTTTTGTTSTTPLIRYRECLKNHAASIGGHVVDGCGEFMPNGQEGTPESLICAACTCHRNFHRKEVEGEPQQQVFNYHSYYSNKSNGQNRIHSHSHLQLNTPHSSLHQHHRLPSHGVTTTTPSAGLIQPMMMAFGGSTGGGPAESSSEDLNMFQSNDGGQLSVQPPLSKKRFRTKFTQEQKDKMMEFAEKLEWKIQKQDEQELQQFCSHVGLKRKVFKVWMHNSKQAMKKKQM